MIEKAKIKSAVKGYVQKLPKELKTRYGGSGKFGYTDGQIRKTVEDLKLNKEYIDYAIIIFCGEEVLKDSGVDSEAILNITKYLSQISSGGNVGADGGGSWSFESFGEAFTGADGGGGFGGEGGGGGDG